MQQPERAATEQRTVVKVKEYYNGLVYSAQKGTGTGDEKSDTHEVTLTISFKEIDELLPAGTLETTEQTISPTFAVAA